MNNNEIFSAILESGGKYDFASKDGKLYMQVIHDGGLSGAVIGKDIDDCLRKLRGIYSMRYVLRVDRKWFDDGVVKIPKSSFGVNDLHAYLKDLGIEILFNEDKEYYHAKLPPNITVIPIIDEATKKPTKFSGLAVINQNGDVEEMIASIYIDNEGKNSPYIKFGK